MHRLSDRLMYLEGGGGGIIMHRLSDALLIREVIHLVQIKFRQDSAQ